MRLKMVGQLLLGVEVGRTLGARKRGGAGMDVEVIFEVPRVLERFQANFTGQSLAFRLESD